MRVFLAIRPPSETVEDLTDFLEPRRDAPGAPRWSAEEQAHVTLAFAAEASPERLDRADEAIREVCEAFERRELSLAGGGVFPDVTRAKVLWAGVQGGEALAPLATRLRNALGVHGIACAPGELRPHVTLGRWRSAVDATRWLRVLDTYEGPSWTAREVEVVASRLGRGRAGHPEHEVLERHPLHVEVPDRWWAAGRRLDDDAESGPPAPEERWWAAGRLLDRADTGSTEP